MNGPLRRRCPRAAWPPLPAAPQAASLRTAAVHWGRSSVFRRPSARCSTSLITASNGCLRDEPLSIASVCLLNLFLPCGDVNGFHGIPMGTCHNERPFDRFFQRLLGAARTSGRGADGPFGSQAHEQFLQGGGGVAKRKTAGRP